MQLITMSNFSLHLTLSAQIPQNGQTHSKNFVGNLPTNCLIVFDHFCGVGA